MKTNPRAKLEHPIADKLASPSCPESFHSFSYKPLMQSSSTYSTRYLVLGAAEEGYWHCEEVALCSGEGEYDDKMAILYIWYSWESDSFLAEILSYRVKSELERLDSGRSSYSFLIRALKIKKGYFTYLLARRRSYIDSGKALTHTTTTIRHFPIGYIPITKETRGGT